MSKNIKNITKEYILQKYDIEKERKYITKSKKDIIYLDKFYQDFIPLCEFYTLLNKAYKNLMCDIAETNVKKLIKFVYDFDYDADIECSIHIKISLAVKEDDIQVIRRLMKREKNKIKRTQQKRKRV